MNWNVNLIVPINIISCSRKNTTYTVTAKSVPEIMDNFGFESRTSFRRKYLNDLVENGKLKMTMPDKPKSKNQKYYS